MEKFYNATDADIVAKERTMNNAESFWGRLAQGAEAQVPEISNYAASISNWWDNLGGPKHNDITTPILIYNYSATESSIDKPDAPVDKTELVNSYLDDIKSCTEYPDAVVNNTAQYEKISPESNFDMREEFNDKREDLLKKWEEQNNADWPRYKEDVYDELSGTLIRRAGDRYDAHHIHPLSLGGKNEAGNITPIHASDHYDRRGIHAPDSSYDKLEKYCKEIAHEAQ